MEKADYLILLVGKNPTPDFISALTYYKEETNIFLVYTKKTEKVISTYNVAKNLEDSIKKILKKASVETIEIDKNNIEEINKSIKKDILSKFEINDNKNIILDFTGGTKIVSAIFNSRFSELNNKNVYFSYVSEKTNEISLFDYRGERVRKKPTIEIAKKYNVSFNELLSIHIGNEECIKDFKDFYIEKISNNGFTLNIDFKIKNIIKRKKDLINVFFDINSLAEKLGGSNVIYTIIINVLKDEKLKNLENEFYENIKNITQISDIKSKIKLKELEG
ncbi:MAG: hypothetical protein ACI33J_03250 [Clostridium sp.]